MGVAAWSAACAAAAAAPVALMGGRGGASGQSSTPFQRICPVTVVGKCRVVSASTPAMLIDVPRHLLRVNMPLALGVIEGGRRYTAISGTDFLLPAV